MKDHWKQAYKEFFYFGIFLILIDILIVAMYMFSDTFNDLELSLPLMALRMIVVTGGYILIGLAFKSHKSWAIVGGYILAALWFIPPLAFLQVIVGLYFLFRVYKAQKNPSLLEAPPASQSV